MDNDEKLSLLQAVRKWPRITTVVLCVGFAILCIGYDSAIVSNVSSMPQFQEVYGVKHGNKYIIPSTWYSLWSVASPIGAMIGAVWAGWIQDRIGRRWMLAIEGLTIAGAVGVVFSSDLPETKDGKSAMFFVGKMLEGFAVGGIGCTTQTYLSEIIPPRLRGPALAIAPFYQLLGQLIASIVVRAQLEVDGRSSYRIALASEWPFAILPLALAFGVPESPVWLIHKDFITRASSSYKKLHNSKRAEGVDERFEELQQTIVEEHEAAKMKEATYLDCFRDSNKRRTLIVVLAETLPELFGLTLLGHASYFVQNVGMSATHSLTFLILGVVLGLLANLCSLLTLSRFGRRRLILITLSAVSVIWLSIGISGCFDSPVVPWYTAAGLMVVIITAGVGVWPASYVVAGETSALRLRSKSQGVGFFMQGVSKCVFGFCSPYLYNLDAAALGAQTGFIIMGTALTGLVLSWFFVPEMKGRTAAEIDKLFETGIPARQFGSRRRQTMVPKSDDTATV